jgi:hypothetical protein
MSNEHRFTEECWNYIICKLISQLNSGCCTDTINAFSIYPNFFENWLVAEFISALAYPKIFKIVLNSNCSGIKPDIFIEYISGVNKYICIVEVKNISINSPNAKKRLFSTDSGESSVVNDYNKLRTIALKALSKILVLYGPITAQHPNEKLCDTNGNISGICLSCIIEKFKKDNNMMSLNYTVHTLKANNMFLLDITVN